MPRTALTVALAVALLAGANAGPGRHHHAGRRHMHPDGFETPNLEKSSEEKSPGSPKHEAQPRKMDPEVAMKATLMGSIPVKWKEIRRRLQARGLGSEHSSKYRLLHVGMEAGLLEHDDAVACYQIADREPEYPDSFLLANLRMEEGRRVPTHLEMLLVMDMAADQLLVALS